MSKKQGKRGTRGAKGLKGAPGSIGKTGLTGSRGKRGLTGPVGKRGAKGKIGRILGPIVPHAVLDTVKKQIGHIYEELAIQMKRMAQVQVELDDVRSKVQQLAAVVKAPPKS